MERVLENWQMVFEKIAQAAFRCRRNPDEIKVVAVTKGVPFETIRRAVMGTCELPLQRRIKLLGENRVQELVKKIPHLPDDLEWHFIGHLQTNKVKDVIGKVELIHSLDRIKLAREIDRRAQEENLVTRVLVQVNLADKTEKFGVLPDKVIGFVEEVLTLPRVKICGLMTIAPFTAKKEEVRPVFRRLSEIAEILKEKIPGIEMEFLSMGMSNDFEVAVEEGANILRIGSAIFGSRS